MDVMKKKQKANFPPLLPDPLDRVPDSSLSVDRKEADSSVFGPLEAVSARLSNGSDEGSVVKRGLLQSLRATHESIVHLLKEEVQDRSGPDILALTRTQLERVLLAALIADDPDRWIQVYQLGSWRADVTHALNMQAFTIRAQKWTDKHEDHLSALLELGRGSGVPEDDLAKIERSYRRGHVDVEDRFKVEVTPPPSKIAEMLVDPQLVQLARLFYQVFNEYNEWAHAGLGAVMYSVIEKHRPRDSHVNWRTYHYNQVVERALPTGYTAMMTVATLFGVTFRSDEDTMVSLAKGWTWVADHSALGIAVWDRWARSALGLLQ